MKEGIVVSGVEYVPNGKNLGMNDKLEGFQKGLQIKNNVNFKEGQKKWEAIFRYYLPFLGLNKLELNSKLPQMMIQMLIEHIIPFCYIELTERV